MPNADPIFSIHLASINMNAALFPTSGLADALLRDVARQVQLPLSDYRLADQHYRALHQHLDREESPLNGRVIRIYAQGGVAIGAAIASRFRTDEFDVDAVIELAIPPFAAPGVVLDTLYAAVNGDRGSRYFGKVTRRTRCVTVDFDNMHVDLTPAALLAGQVPRISHIFHAHERDPQHLHRHVTANPWGFAQWFEQQMPAALYFADSVMRKMAEPLPAPEEMEEKALPLIALQLVKRWRNKRYDIRQGVRRPPSVLLSYFAATFGGRRASLLAELTAQAQNLLGIFEELDRRGALVEVRNPTCAMDVFSDRWPENLAEQRRFTADLTAFVADLAVLEARAAFEECGVVMARLFGERPVQRVVEAFADRYGAQAFGNGLRQYAGSGAIALGGSPLASSARPSGNSFIAPRSTNFGSDG
jgi:hypothetical protein